MEGDVSEEDNLSKHGEQTVLRNYSIGYGYSLMLYKTAEVRICFIGRNCHILGRCARQAQSRSLFVEKNRAASQTQSLHDRMTCIRC